MIFSFSMEDLTVNKGKKTRAGRLNNRGAIVHGLVLAAVVVAAAGLRIWWIHFCDTVPVYDFLKYHLGAVSLAQGNGYKLFGNYTAFEPIGLGAWLAGLYRVFGVDYFVPKVANVVLGTISVGLIYLQGRRFFGPSAGLLAAVLLAFSPRNIIYTSVISTEVLFTFLFLLALWVLTVRRESAGLYLLVGVLGAALAFVKPNLLVFPVLVFMVRGAMGLRTTGQWKASAVRSMKKAGLVALVMAVVIAPWTLRNYRVFGKFIPISTNGGITLFLNNNDYATGAWQDPFVLPDSPIAGMRNPETGFWDEIKVDEIAGAAARQWIRENPGTFFRMGFTKNALVYRHARDVQFAIDYTSSGGPLTNRGWIYTWSHRVWRGFLGAMAFAGVVTLFNLLFKRRHLVELWTLFVPWVMFSATFFVFEGQPRYVFPLLPLLILWVSWSIMFVLGRLSDHAQGSVRTNGRKPAKRASRG